MMSVSEHICDGVSLVEKKCPGTNAQTLRCSVVTSAPQKTRHSERSISSNTGNQLKVCESHRVLDRIYRDKGETEKAISHLETALRIASSFNWAPFKNVPSPIPDCNIPRCVAVPCFLSYRRHPPPVLIVLTSCTLASFYACRPTTRPSTLLSPVMYFSHSCASLGLHVTLGALESNYCIC